MRTPGWSSAELTTAATDGRAMAGLLVEQSDSHIVLKSMDKRLTRLARSEVERIELYTRQFKTMMQTAAGVRRAGAAALDLAYVACGRLDAFWEMGLSAWDMAAGALMILEAGGLVGDLRGDAGYLDSGEIACATPKVFSALLEALR